MVVARLRGSVLSTAGADGCTGFAAVLPASGSTCVLHFLSCCHRARQILEKGGLINRADFVQASRALNFHACKARARLQNNDKLLTEGPAAAELNCRAHKLGCRSTVHGDPHCWELLHAADEQASALTKPLDTELSTVRTAAHSRAASSSERRRRAARSIAVKSEFVPAAKHTGNGLTECDMSFVWLRVRNDEGLLCMTMEATQACAPSDTLAACKLQVIFSPRGEARAFQASYIGSDAAAITAKKITSCRCHECVWASLPPITCHG